MVGSPAVAPHLVFCCEIYISWLCRPLFFVAWITVLGRQSIEGDAMRSTLGSLFGALLLVAMAFGFVAPGASAQTYPPVVPTDAGTPSEQIVAVIQGNNLVREVERAVAQGNLTAAQQQADALQTLLTQAQTNGFSAQVISDLTALLARAQAISSPAAVPASPPLGQPPALAFTGSSANLPAAVGAGFVGAGGLLLLWSRKRTLAAQRQN